MPDEHDVRAGRHGCLTALGVEGDHADGDIDGRLEPRQHGQGVVGLGVLATRIATVVDQHDLGAHVYHLARPQDRVRGGVEVHHHGDTGLSLAGQRLVDAGIAGHTADGHEIGAHLGCRDDVLPGTVDDLDVSQDGALRKGRLEAIEHGEALIEHDRCPELQQIDAGPDGHVSDLDGLLNGGHIDGDLHDRRRQSEQSGQRL